MLDAIFARLVLLSVGTVRKGKRQEHAKDFTASISEDPQ